MLERTDVGHLTAPRTSSGASQARRATCSAMSDELAAHDEVWATRDHFSRERGHILRALELRHDDGGAQGRGGPWRRDETLPDDVGVRTDPIRGRRVGHSHPIVHVPTLRETLAAARTTQCGTDPARLSDKLALPYSGMTSRSREIVDLIMDAATNAVARHRVAGSHGARQGDVQGCHLRPLAGAVAGALRCDSPPPRRTRR